jgi:hypothetical protein
MLNWLRRDPAKTARFGERILEGMREIGVLLFAFAPLDAALQPRDISGVAGFLAVFLGSGALLFFGALVIEWRYTR